MLRPVKVTARSGVGAAANPFVSQVVSGTNPGAPVGGNLETCGAKGVPLVMVGDVSDKIEWDDCLLRGTSARSCGGEKYVSSVRVCSGDVPGAAGREEERRDEMNALLPDGVRGW